MDQSVPLEPSDNLSQIKDWVRNFVKKYTGRKIEEVKNLLRLGEGNVVGKYRLSKSNN
jgi:preprotein translocase subunit Sec63